MNVQEKRNLTDNEADAPEKCKPQALRDFVENSGKSALP